MIYDFFQNKKIKKEAKKLYNNYINGKDNNLSLKITRTLSETNDFAIDKEFFRDLSGLKEGYFISKDKCEKKDYVLSVFLIEKAMEGKQSIFFFDSLDRKKTIASILMSSKFIDEINFEPNESELIKREFYNQDIILIEIDVFGIDLLNTFHSTHIEELIVKDKIFKRMAIIDDLKSITILGEYRHSIVNEQEGDIPIIKEALEVVECIIDETSLFAIKENEYVLTDKGISYLEDRKMIENIFDTKEDYLLLFYIEKILNIRHMYLKGKDYHIIEGEDVISHNKKIDRVEKRLIQGIENLDIDLDIVEKEGFSNFLLFYHFENILGISYSENKYLAFLEEMFNIKTISFFKDTDVSLRTVNKDIQETHTQAEVFGSYSMDNIYIDNNFNYAEIKHIEVLLSDKEVSLVNFDIKKSKKMLDSKIEDQKMLITYQLLIWKKMMVYHKIKEKIVNLDNVIDIVTFFFKNTDTELSPESVLNCNNNASLNLVSMELFLVINRGREKMFEEIRSVLDNLYFSTLNKKDPFIVIEKKLYLLLEETVKEVYYESLIKLKNKNFNNGSHEVGVVSY